MPRPPSHALNNSQEKEEDSATVRARVEHARAVQLERQGCANAMLSGKSLERHCNPRKDAQQLLVQAIDRLGLSARAYHRVLKVGRTIADLAGETVIAKAHIAEAITYRRLDRRY